MWTPDSNEFGAEFDVDASAAFGHPLRVHTTHDDMARLVQRLRGESKPRITSISNRTFRSCVGPVPEGEEEFGRYCGDVLVFYCARLVIDGRGVPIAAFEDGSKNKESSLQACADEANEGGGSGRACSETGEGVVDTPTE